MQGCMLGVNTYCTVIFVIVPNFKIEMVMLSFVRKNNAGLQFLFFFNCLHNLLLRRIAKKGRMRDICFFSRFICDPLTYPVAPVNIFPEFIGITYGTYVAIWHCCWLITLADSHDNVISSLWGRAEDIWQ